MKMLADFEAYLQKRDYATKSITQYRESVRCFLAWTEQQAILPIETGYADLLLFLQYCQRQHHSQGTQRGHTTALRHLFAMLRKQHKMNYNPAEGLFITRRAARLPHDLLEMKDLLQIYEACSDSGLHKLLLSLVVFQALRKEELSALYVHHLHLKAGKVIVPATAGSNRRVLALSMEQIMPFYEWIKDKSPHDRLFLSPKGSQNLGNAIQVLIQQLQGINPEVRHLRQIRQSVIAHWLKSQDVRQVQYMAGHKWVSSTERYQQTDLQDLQNKLAKHHPLQ